MLRKVREQIKLPIVLLAAFCLTIMVLGGVLGYARTRKPDPAPARRPEQRVAGQQLVAGPLNVPILMYHHVGYLPQNPDPLDRDLTVSPEDFQQQLEYFKAKEYQSVSLVQLLDAAQGKGDLPQHPIVFTFDDGWKDVFEYAVPALRKNGYSGSFAIATSLLGRPGYAEWPDVLAARDQGMEIISHSENHLDLTNPVYSSSDLDREISGAKQELESHLNQVVSVYVYPYGKYDERVMKLVENAGYSMALTTKYSQTVRPDALFETGRVRVHGQDGLAKLKKIFEAGQTGSVPPNP